MVKNTTAAIEVVFKGNGVSPERIPLTTMSRALAAVQRLSIGEESLPGDDEPLLTALRLVDVKKGSAVFPCASEIPLRTIQNLKLVGQVLQQSEDADRLAYGFGQIRDLSAVAKQLGCTLIMRTPGREGEVLATIQPDTYAQIAESLLIEGDTLITGRVERAGGTTAEKCALRLTNQPRLLYCEIESTDTRLVKKLGQRLYEDVAVSGAATWIRSTWKIIEFKIRELHERKERSLTDIIKNVRKIGGRGWGRISDPEKYLDEVTGEH